MRRYRLLDLFCAEGGASAGYADARYAGARFDVVGSDVEPQPGYPFEFVKADAFDLMADREFMAGFDVVTGSPPCIDHTELARFNKAGDHGTAWMLQATIDALTRWGRPWVVENVRAADMPGSLQLCGTEFGLVDGPYELRRHRQFASNVFLMGAGGCAHSKRSVIGVYGDIATNDRRSVSRARVAAGQRPKGDMRAGLDRARRIMGMPWATAAGVAKAIPPAYTRFIGEQLLAALDRA